METATSRTFVCAYCSAEKPIKSEGGTGYATLSDGSRICYTCSAKREREDLVKSGRGVLYFTPSRATITGRPIRRDGGWGECELTNWTGVLRFSGGYRVGRHNMAGRRYDAWFNGPDGFEWHGVTYGDNTQICHVRRLKGKR